MTGATGFLGREVVCHLLERDPDVQLLAVIRARNDEDLSRRRQRLADLLPEAQRPRLQAIRGDIEQPDMGMSPSAYAGLAERLDRVMHIAASTNFDHSLEEARRINVGGTEQALRICRAIAKRGKSGRLDYVGTAYVAGDRTGTIYEEELAAGQGFRNTYEQSKYEAELLCRKARAEVPVALYRPSIIVGDSGTGKTTSYKTIYWPMKVLVRFYGLSRPILPRLVRLPVRPECLLDIVPVNFVADAVSRLYGEEQAVGHCYHLAAGPDAASIEELVNLACDHFGVPRIGFLDPDGPIRWAGRAMRPLLSRIAPRLTKNGELMLAYTRQNPRFDITTARQAGLSPPHYRDYFPRLINYAHGADFGRDNGSPS